MRNRFVGALIIGIAALIGLIIFLFNRGLTQIVNTSCTHGDACPMWGTINFQTNVSIGIMSFVVIIGLYLVFFGEEEKVIEKIVTKTKIKTVKEQVEPKKLTKENYEKIMENLEEDERKVLEIILDSDGSAYQSEIVEKSSLTKVQITRILDKLEGKELIERKRRGMTNIVILKK